MAVAVAACRLLLRAVGAIACVALPVVAQALPLTPGSFVATTIGLDGLTGLLAPAGHGLFVADLYAHTSAPLSVSGFPALAGEAPWHVYVESPTSFLLASWVMPGTTNVVAGDLYRVALSNGVWTAVSLLTSPLGEGVEDVVVVGAEIWFTSGSQFSFGLSPSSKLWRLPLAGGTPTLVADLAAMGVPGGGATIGVDGTDLHLLTFVSAPATQPAVRGEHWKCDITTAPPTLTRLSALPHAIRNGSTGNEFGALAARWDVHRDQLAVLGVYGEVLWRDRAGVDGLRRALPGVPQVYGDFLAPAFAFDEDDGSLVWGDKEGHLELLRTANSSTHPDFLTLAPIVPAFHRFVMGASYVPGAARNLPDGPDGCPRVTEWMVNTTTARPAIGATNIVFKLEALAGSAFFALGFGNTQWNGAPLPFSLPLAPQCQLGTSAEFVTFVATGLNGLTVNVPQLPSTPCVVYTQWFVAQANANPLGIAASDVRRVEVR